MKALLSLSAIFAFLFALGVQTFEPFKTEKQEYSSTSALEKQLRKDFTIVNRRLGYYFLLETI